MRAWARILAAVATPAWAWLRAVSGDDAYEAYLSRGRRKSAVPTREQFYMERLRRRYSRLNRCC